jgi:hypothetical protein
MGNALAKLTRQDASNEAVNDSMLVDDTELEQPSPSLNDDFPMALDDEQADITLDNDLLDDRSRWNANGNREKQCLTCGDWIDLGKALTGENALVNHEGKRRCLAKVESNAQKRELEAAEASRHYL